MRRAIWATLFGLAACSPSADDRLIDLAKDRVAAQLPGQAAPQFRNVAVASSDMGRRLGEVCGEVLGQANGWRRFIFMRQAGTVVIDQTAADVAGELAAHSELQPMADQNTRLFEEQWGDCGAGRG